MNFSEMESENSTTTNAPFLFTIIPISVRFWIYLIADILSVLCSLFVLYYLLFDRTLRQALNNHVIIVLITFNSTILGKYQQHSHVSGVLSITLVIQLK